MLPIISAPSLLHITPELKCWYPHLTQSELKQSQGAITGEELSQIPTVTFRIRAHFAHAKAIQVTLTINKPDTVSSSSSSSSNLVSFYSTNLFGTAITDKKSTKQLARHRALHTDPAYIDGLLSICQHSGASSLLQREVAIRIVAELVLCKPPEVLLHALRDSLDIREFVQATIILGVFELPTLAMAADLVARLMLDAPTSFLERCTNALVELLPSLGEYCITKAAIRLFFWLLRLACPVDSDLAPALSSRLLQRIFKLSRKQLNARSDSHALVATHLDIHDYGIDAGRLIDQLPCDSCLHAKVCRYHKHNALHYTVYFRQFIASTMISRTLSLSLSSQFHGSCYLIYTHLK
jgi:hypothetical protein